MTETSQALSQKTTLKVPPQSLGLARRCQKVSWAVTTLDTGTEKRAVRTVPDDQAFGSLESWQYATFEFGENVPRRWANVIRRDPALREFVPDGELSRDGDFDLKDPDSGPPPKAKIVDDKAKTFKKYRTGWKRQAAGYRGRSFWTPVQAKRVQRYATWRTQLAAPGEYGVYVYYPKKHATTRKAVYKITTKTGIKTRARNQKLTAGRWVKLGTFDFGWWGTVKLTDKTGERTASRRSVVFDAVKFVPVSPAVAATPKVVAPSVKRSAPKTTPPVAKPDGAVKIRLYPKTLDALVFARKTVSAWTCPADDRSPFGPDGRPGTGDDACDPIVAQWSLENEATGRLNKRTGHKVLVQMVDMEQNRLIAKWQDQVRPALLTPLPRPADKPAPRLITEP